MPSKLSHSRRLPLITALLASTASLLAPSAHAAYPDHAIRLIVPFSAGGSSDLQARMVADRLGKLYGVPVVVENRPGAGGHIGGKAVADAPADGYTLLLGSIGLHATYATYPKLNYNPATDLKVVTVLAEMPHVVVVNPHVQATNLKQLVEAAGKRPQGMTFGSAGVGSSVHMIGELFRVTTGAQLTHVPYKGSSSAMADLLGGQIDMMFENPPTTLGYIRSGKLKALAVTGKTRLPALPQVPTAVESGVPGFVATSWTTIAVGAKVPDAIADKLNADIRAIAATQEFRNGLAEQGMTPVANTRDAAAKFIGAEKARWDEVIKKAKLSAE